MIPKEPYTPCCSRSAAQFTPQPPYPYYSPQPPYGQPTGWYVPPQPPSPHQLERRALRRDGNFVGGILLAITAGTQLTFSVLVFFLMLCGVLTFDQLQQPLLGMSKMTYLLLYAGVYTFAMLVPALLVALCSGRRYFPLSPHERVNAGDTFFGVLAAMGLCMAANVVAGIVAGFLEQLGAKVPETPDLLEHTPQSLLLYMAVFAVLPALIEELLLRGYVLRSLRPYGDWFAVTVSALVFGLMHGNIEQIPFAFCVGMALGWLCVMTDNIWLCVAVHFCNNAMSCLMEYFTLDMSTEDAGLFNTIVIYAVLFIGLIALLVLLVRRSELFRRLPRKSLLTGGERFGTLLSAPAFLIAVLLMGIITIWEAVM